MPRPPIDLHRKIRDILHHVQPLPDEANAPDHALQADHCRHLGVACVSNAHGQSYKTVLARHLGRIYGF